MKTGKPLELITYLYNQDKDKIYDLTEHKEKRSLNANSYFHVLVNKLARHYNFSDEDMKIKLNLDYGTIATDDDGIIGVKVPKGRNIKQFYKYAKWYKLDKDNCDCYVFYKETHTLDSKEFSQLLNGTVQECKDAGIQTLDDKEIQNLIDNMEV